MVLQEMVRQVSGAGISAECDLVSTVFHRLLKSSFVL